MIRDKLYIFIDGPTNKPTRFTCRISLLLTKATVIMPISSATITNYENIPDIELIRISG